MYHTSSYAVRSTSVQTHYSFYLPGNIYEYTTCNCTTVLLYVYVRVQYPPSFSKISKSAVQSIIHHPHHSVKYHSDKRSTNTSTSTAPNFTSSLSQTNVKGGATQKKNAAYDINLRLYWRTRYNSQAAG